MDAEEINGLLWETLASAGRLLSSKDLALETGQTSLAVQAGLARLRQANLIEVEVDVSVPGTVYAVILDLDALRWAQAVSLGVGLLSLERHARLSSANRAKALRMATDGSLERLEEGVRSSKRQARDEAIQGRAASKAAASDLARILEDTTAALSCAKKSPDGRDRAIAKLLEQANSEAQNALSGLVKSLATK